MATSKALAVQQQMYIRWTNDQLQRSGMSITNLTELHDGVGFAQILRSLGLQLPGVAMNPRGHIHKMNNVGLVIRVAEDAGVRLTGVSSDAVVKGEEKAILALLWSLILHFHISSSVVPAGQRVPPPKALMAWVTERVAPYNLQVTNFSACFQDGLLFCALVHSMTTNALSMEQVQELDPVARMEMAFSVAKEKIYIPRVIEPQDVVSGDADESCIMTYVAYFLQASKGRLAPPAASPGQSLDMNVSSGQKPDELKMQVQGQEQPLPAAAVESEVSPQVVLDATVPIQLGPVRARQVVHYVQSTPTTTVPPTPSMPTDSNVNDQPEQTNSQSLSAGVDHSDTHVASEVDSTDVLDRAHSNVAPPRPPPPPPPPSRTKSSVSALAARFQQADVQKPVLRPVTKPVVPKPLLTAENDSQAPDHQNEASTTSSEHEQSAPEVLPPGAPVAPMAIPSVLVQDASVAAPLQAPTTSTTTAAAPVEPGFQKPAPPGRRPVVRSRSSSETERPATSAPPAAPPAVPVMESRLQHPDASIKERPIRPISPALAEKNVMPAPVAEHDSLKVPLLSQSPSSTEDSPLKSTMKRASAAAHPLTSSLFPEDDDVAGSPMMSGSEPSGAQFQDAVVANNPALPSHQQRQSQDPQRLLRSRNEIDGFTVVGPPVLESVDHSLSQGLPPLPDLPHTTQTEIAKLVLYNKAFLAQTRALREANIHLNLTVQRQQAINTGKGVGETEYIWVGPVKPQHPTARGQTLPQLGAQCEHADSYLFMCESRIAAAELRASADDMVAHFLHEQAAMYAQLMHSRAELTQVKSRLQQVQSEGDELRKRIAILLQEHLSAGHMDIYLPPPDIERERRMDTLLRQVEDLTAQVNDERTMRSQLQAALVELQRTVIPEEDAVQQEST